MTTAQEVANEWRYCYAIAINLTSDGSYAEEVAQEVMLKALSSLRQFRYGSLRKWLAAIVYNVVIEGYRSKRATKRDYIYVGDPWAMIEQASTPAAQEDAVMLHEVERAIAGLSAKKASVLRMAALGYSHREMSERLSSPPVTVRTRLCRAREALTEAIQ